VTIIFFVIAIYFYILL